MSAYEKAASDNCTWTDVLGISQAPVVLPASQGTMTLILSAGGPPGHGPYPPPLFSGGVTRKRGGGNCVD